MHRIGNCEISSVSGCSEILVGTDGKHRYMPMNYTFLVYAFERVVAV